MDTQMQNVVSQMDTLDDYVTSARGHNETHYLSQTSLLNRLSSNIEASQDTVSQSQLSVSSAVADLRSSATAAIDEISMHVTNHDSKLRPHLDRHLQDISNTPIRQNLPTGSTPQKTEYQYPKTLPTPPLVTSSYAPSPNEDVLAELKQVPNANSEPPPQQLSLGSMSPPPMKRPAPESRLPKEVTVKRRMPSRASKRG